MRTNNELRKKIFKKVFTAAFCIATALSITFTPVFTTPAKAAISTSSVLKPGSGYSSSTKWLQQNLNVLAFSAGKVDGIYGNNTTNAVKKFQQAVRKCGYNITIDGIAGPQTISYLNTASINLQKLLNSKGFGNLTTDGLLGSATIAAINNARRTYGLAETGIYDAALAAKLGSSDTSNSTSSSSTSYNTALQYANSTYEVQGSKECVLTSISMLINSERLVEGRSKYCTKATVRRYNNNVLSAYWSRIANNANAANANSRKLTFRAVNGLSATTLRLYLSSHPAGVMIYCKGSNGNAHAVLVRCYENGNFYVSDPSSSRYKFVKLTSCYLMNGRYSWTKSMTGILSAVREIGYYQ